MSLYQPGVILKALLENPELINPPKAVQDGTKKKDDDFDNLFAGQSAFLGPTDLWDKTLAYDGSDFKLEYMDIDRFFEENGISSSGDTPSEHPQVQPSPVKQTPELVRYTPDSTPTKPVLVKQDIQETQPPTISDSKTPSCVAKEPVEIGGEDRPCRNNVREEELILATIPDHRETDHTFKSVVPKVDSNTSGAHVETNIDDDDDDDEDEDGEDETSDLYLAQLPGEHSFDPRKRQFTDDELRPQPMIKKSKKIFVPDSLKDEKYWSRRKKNNVAAKRSRDARRIKENQIVLRASFLEKTNAQLESDIDQLKMENQSLKDRLAKYETV